MSLGNSVVLTPEPRGRRIECIIDGTPKPGTVMQVKAAVEPMHGRFTWEVYNRAGDGVAWLIAILDADFLQGMKMTDAYEDGKHGFLYFPLPGDELNMLVGDVAGTGATSDFAIGDPLAVDDGTGKLIDASVGTGAYLTVPFICMETYADMSADTHIRTMFTGY